MFAASIYFAWWLLVTPTQKAWHRRILDGSLLLNIAWIYIGAMFVEHAMRRWSPARAHVAMIATTVLAVLGALAFATVDLRPKLIADTRPRDGFDNAVRTLRDLPADAVVFGVGWNSAPALSLLSERPFMDFNDTIIRDIPPGTPTYLALDAPALSLKKQDPIIAMYPSRPLLPDGGSTQVYRIDLTSPGLIPEAQQAGPSHGGSAVSMGAPPSILRGFHRANRDGQRWMTAQGLVGMTYNGEETLSVMKYAPNLKNYAGNRGLALAASIDGCKLGEVPVDKGGFRVVQFSIPGQCRPDDGKQVVVRLDASNLVESAITNDDRAMSMLVAAVGFTNACTDTASCRKELAREATAPEPAAAVPAQAQAQAHGDSALRATPSFIDLCQNPDGFAEVTVDWTVPPSHAGKPWNIRVSAPGEPPKLWVSGSAKSGTDTTGRWVRDSTTFELTTTEGGRLDTLTLFSRPCPQ